MKKAILFFAAALLFAAPSFAQEPCEAVQNYEAEVVAPCQPVETVAPCEAVSEIVPACGAVASKAADEVIQIRVRRVPARWRVEKRVKKAPKKCKIVRVACPVCVVETTETCEFTLIEF